MVAQHRARVCSECPHMQVHTADSLIPQIRAFFKVARLGFKGYTGWCGEPGVRFEGGTCGCLCLSEPTDSDGLVRITIEEREIQLDSAGKTTVQFESCPLGRW